PGLMAAVLGRDAAGEFVRKAGIMAIVVAGGEVRPGDAIAVELPAGGRAAPQPGEEGRARPSAGRGGRWNPPRQSASPPRPRAARKRPARGTPAPRRTRAPTWYVRHFGSNGSRSAG